MAHLEQSEIELMADTIPILHATLDKGRSDRWKVWCKYCEDFHFHGASDGHRAAHCSMHSSPYKETGYIIVGLFSTHERRRTSAAVEPMTGLATKGKL
jgi:hypothetical protein